MTAMQSTARQISQDTHKSIIDMLRADDTNLIDQGLSAAGGVCEPSNLLLDALVQVAGYDQSRDTPQDITVEQSLLAAQTIGCFGTNALAFLRTVLEREDPQSLSGALDALSCMAINEQLPSEMRSFATSIAFKLLDHPDSMLAGDAKSFLGNLEGNPK